jgi:hypothetical protein
MSQSPFSLLDITTTVSGLFCRWDSHPLERQLASLHQILSCANNTGAGGAYLSDGLEKGDVPRVEFARSIDVRLAIHTDIYAAEAFWDTESCPATFGWPWPKSAAQQSDLADVIAVVAFATERRVRKRNTLGGH